MIRVRITAKVGRHWVTPQEFVAPNLDLAFWLARHAFGPLATAWRVV